jgi:redox-sensitive bicupin YhaK (pirin superfamily)
MTTASFTRLQVQRQRMGSGLTVAGVRGQPGLMDPFLMADHFHMTQPTFPPHPHAGFSAVTYLFEDSETGFRNRDALGFDGPIHPGSLHWTLAGSGTLHEEFPLEAGKLAHGLQIFINLPEAEQLQAPRALHLEDGEMPRIDGAGWRAKLVFGRFGAERAPLALPVDASLAIVDVQAGRGFDVPLREGEQGFALLVSGSARVGDEALPEGAVMAYPQPLRFEAESPLRLAIFSGTPLRQPVVQHGPFAMNSEARVVDAMRRFQQGEMGRLESAA